jgi:uncharacterized protein YjbI with pentapeptide repeats
MKGVMNTSEQYHQPVLEALCAIVRDSAAHGASEKINDKPATDVQAALTVIGRRKLGYSGVNLAGANISRADLRGASLLNASLSGANLSNVQNLAQAQLDTACGTDAKLPPDLTLKPCPPK